MRPILTAVLTVMLLNAPAPAAGDRLSDAANAAYLAGNAKQTGVVSLPGIQYQVIKRGKGAQPGRHDCVTVNYKGWLIDGKVFDQTKGKPATFPAGALIPGWVEALQMMHAGDKWKLVIPAGLAYGRTGAGDGAIPPNQTLVFEIELLKVFPPTPKGCQ
ncbi:MAG: FKBP-type peptidyl-prolyl cis-trans isomerase [Alphaproteobacteria bacterium]|nr:FKBP-type peptidyl-prolyl cis-trans isomerase [Alphaproteobacteria bacterium]MDE2631147.1 FKBP-type peptidyl-prolyl cis-trans isomerase [Alphaproteobacteria bacterium]